jgi:hypothetical protein
VLTFVDVKKGLTNVCNSRLQFNTFYFPINSFHFTLGDVIRVPSRPKRLRLHTPPCSFCLGYPARRGSRAARGETSETAFSCNVNRDVNLLCNIGRGDDRPDALLEPSMQPKGPARVR